MIVRFVRAFGRASVAERRSTEAPKPGDLVILDGWLFTIGIPRQWEWRGEDADPIVTVLVVGPEGPPEVSNPKETNE